MELEADPYPFVSLHTWPVQSPHAYLHISQLIIIPHTAQFYVSYHLVIINRESEELQPVYPSEPHKKANYNV